VSVGVGSVTRTKAYSHCWLRCTRSEAQHSAGKHKQVSHTVMCWLAIHVQLSCRWQTRRSVTVVWCSAFLPTETAPQQSAGIVAAEF